MICDCVVKSLVEARCALALIRNIEVRAPVIAGLGLGANDVIRS